MRALLIAKVSIVICIAGLAAAVMRRRLSWKGDLFLFSLIFWFGYFCSGVISTLPKQREAFTLTALGTKNEAAIWYQVSLSGYEMDGEEDGFFYALDGGWLVQSKGEASNESRYVWVPDDDALWQEGITRSIVLDIPAGKGRALIFDANVAGGQVQIDYLDSSTVVDTYSDQGEQMTVPFPDSPEQVLYRCEKDRMPAFCAMFAACSALTIAAALFVTDGRRFIKIKRYRFLFEELVKRDFTLKYKRTILGMLWSILSPLMNLLIMWLVFNRLLGSSLEHYVIYLFSGQMIFSYFSDATTQGMTSLLDNASIFTKINVPKYLFLFSKNVSSLINFGLTLVVYFIFVLMDGLRPNVPYLMLIYPVACLVVFNLGIGMILSALFVFFRDMQYLWGILTQLIMWLSAIFYPITTFPYEIQSVFLLNPLYLFIRYFRKVVIESAIPSVGFHLLMGGYAAAAMAIGCWFYKRYNHEFLYYV